MNRQISNYTVKWTLEDGTKKSAVNFPSLEEAESFVQKIERTKGIGQVLILRAGRHPSASRWLTTAPYAGKHKEEDRHWIEPIGYVDTERDKHGSMEYAVTTTLSRPRTNAEKGEWAKNYRPNNFVRPWKA